MAGHSSFPSQTLLQTFRYFRISKVPTGIHATILVTPNIPMWFYLVAGVENESWRPTCADCHVKARRFRQYAE